MLQLPPRPDHSEQYPAEELEYLVIATYNRAIDAHVVEDDAACARLAQLVKQLAGHMDDAGGLLRTISGNLDALRTDDGEDVEGDEGSGDEYSDEHAMGPLDVEG